jgi:hypothetical protein
LVLIIQPTVPKTGQFGQLIISLRLSLERQLPANTALAITYTYSHGVHLFRSEDINAPLPGTFNPNVQGSASP